MKIRICILNCSPTSGCKKLTRFRLLQTKKLATIERLRKKYKRAKKVVNWSAAGSSVLSAAFSSASFDSALSVVGLPATIPLGGVGGAFALASSGLIIASKKLDSKIKNIRRLSRLPSLNTTLSKALADKQITDSEFQLIMTEFSQDNVLKDAVRAELTRQSSRPDVEKISKDLRSEMEADFRKKTTALATGSN